MIQDTEMFGCLADGEDYSPCCATRGVPYACTVSINPNAVILEEYPYQCTQSNTFYDLIVEKYHMSGN